MVNCLTVEDLAYKILTIPSRTADTNLLAKAGYNNTHRQELNLLTSASQ